MAWEGKLPSRDKAISIGNDLKQLIHVFAMHYRVTTKFWRVHEKLGLLSAALRETLVLFELRAPRFIIRARLHV